MQNGQRLAKSGKLGEDPLARWTRSPRGWNVGVAIGVAIGGGCWNDISVVVAD